MFARLRSSSQPPAKLSNSIRDSKVIYQGFLEKRGRLNTAFKKRWCALKEDGRLYYYKPTDKETARDSIPLEQVEVRLAFSEKFAFEIVSKDRIYHFLAPSQEERVAWMNALSARTSIGEENNLIDKAEEMIERATYLRSKVEEDLSSHSPPTLSSDEDQFGIDLPIPAPTNYSPPSLSSLRRSQSSLTPLVTISSSPSSYDEHSVHPSLSSHSPHSPTSSTSHLSHATNSLSRSYSLPHLVIGSDPSEDLALSPSELLSPTPTSARDFHSTTHFHPQLIQQQPSTPQPDSKARRKHSFFNLTQQLSRRKKGNS